MSLPLDLEDALLLVDGAAGELRGNTAALGVLMFAELLDRLCELYRIKLTTCQADQVVTLQAAHKQCRLLRSTLTEDGASPTVL